VAFVHVDLDDLWVYEQDYGLPAPGTGSIYDEAVPRLLDLFEAHGARATLFAVGRDLERERARKVLRGALARGHAVANHTLDHRADLGACDAATRARQVLDGDAAIRAALGVTPVGFRGPGYVFDDVVHSALEERRYRYDSTRYPGWIVPLMNVAMRSKGATKALRRAPIALPEWSGGPPPDAPLVEVPIMTVTRLLLPAHTTAQFAFGTIYARALRALLRPRAPRGAFLLHAVDGLDTAAAPHLAMLPALARPLAERLGLIAGALDALRAHGELTTTEAALA
jgi:peptidoglycan-N-acetylglucosamine deacetylase